MSASTHLTCPLGFTPDDLSAWRDQTLSPQDERRIADHASGCPVCQHTLAAHDVLATVLRAEQPPAPDPRNWSQLQARIAANGRRSSSSSAQPLARRPAIWGGLGAAAAVLLLSALFFRLFTQQASVRGDSSRNATPTVIPTPQALQAVAPTAPIAGPALHWQSRPAPDSVVPPPGNQTDNSNIAFAPTDAQTAYICFTQYASHPSPVAVWATHDGARTWAHVSDLPAISWGPDCIITVDANDPLRLNVVDYGQDMSSTAPAILSAISDDGGKTWSTLSDGVALRDLVTRDGTGIAIADPITNLFDPTHTRPARLVISHDNFRTWTPIDSQLSSQEQSVSRIWQRPGDGALLALVGTFHPAPHTTPSVGPKFPLLGITTYALWTSANMGASWTPFLTPPNLAASTGYLVAQPTGTSPWQVCGLTIPNGVDAPTSPQNELIGCTRNGGQTWTSRPLPALKQTCGTNCAQQELIEPLNARLLSDGSLVTTFFVGPSSGGVMQANTAAVFRLAPGATQWQDLGAPPSNEVLVTDSASGATAISYAGGMTGSVSGNIVGHLGGDIPNRGVLAFAQLP